MFARPVIFPAKLLAEKYDTDKRESSFLYYNPPTKFQRGQIHFSSFTAKPREQRETHTEEEQTDNIFIICL